MKKKKKQLEKGFTLIETMITMAIFLVILMGVYMMIQHYGEVTKSEHSRLTMQQESRYMVSSFADEIKEAGAVLTLAHTSKFLAAPAFFNGLYPLNSSYYPDGLILATGDPEAVTVLTADFVGSGAVLNVASTTVNSYDPSFPYENPQWAPGQKGIVIGTNGYLVFEVASVSSGSTTIDIRSTPVYYSGLLATGSYYDDAEGNSAGNTLTYSVNSPVIRLTNFSIYLFRDVHDKKLSERLEGPSGPTQIIRQMIRITDTNGQADPLADGSGASYSVISENIWDMQISYIAYADFKAANFESDIDPTHHYFADHKTPSSASDLMNDIRGRLLKQMDITLIAIADYRIKGEVTTPTNIPPIGDNASQYFPNRKLSYRLFSFSVEPKNFNISL